MIGYFVKVCKRRNLKVMADKSKLMVLGGKEGSVCEVFVDGTQLEHISELKYFRYVCVAQIMYIW